ncbi:MAG: YvcK family protein [Pseudomonadales bacterium]|nr:YvcK family protein [Candidatus Woesebacteria bacterium]MCB9802143.1 YvcK family protein [Pseudomonadales bacterium]
MSKKKKPYNVVVMGGGTGTFGVITALKELPVTITTLIAVSDSGGSTGRIRDEFGFQPVGDLRQSLAALAESEHENWIQNILLYRFNKGSGLKGHNLGNLILTALQDMTSSTTESLGIASRIFRLSGTVLPVTDENVNLKIHYTDGTSEVGEHILDENPKHPKTIKKVTLVPNCSLSSQAQQAIESADLIIIGPGDYYASIMATLMVDGVQTAFKTSSAKVLYVLNLMTRKTQTHGMSATVHQKGIEAAIGQPVDWMLVNTDVFSSEILARYAAEKEYPVLDDTDVHNTHMLKKPLASTTVVEKSEHDTAHRSLIRHDSAKLQHVLENILEKL